MRRRAIASALLLLAAAVTFSIVRSEGLVPAPGRPAPVAAAPSPSPLIDGSPLPSMPRSGPPEPAPTPSPPPSPTPVATPSPTPRWSIDVAPIATPVAASHTWELAAAGGVIFGRGVQERIEKYKDPLRPFAKVRDIFRSADLALATLEAPMSGNNNKYCDGCLEFIGNERYVAGLVDAGFDVMSLAANHSGDAGEQGVLDSIRTLRTAGIAPFGAGPDLSTARRPAVIEVKGTRVAFLGYNDVPPQYYGATATRPGHNHLSQEDPTYAAVRADIAAARGLADLVIVVPHWGIEYEDKPRDWIVNAAHAMVDAGADVVLGDHPHWVQSVEIYKDRYIAYSMGNFVFDQMWSMPTRLGSIHRLFFDGARLVAVRIQPTLLEDWHQPRPLAPNEPGYAETVARIWKNSKLTVP